MPLSRIRLLASGQRFGLPQRQALGLPNRSIRSRFDGAHEPAVKLLVHQRRDRVRVDPLAVEKLASFGYMVHAGRLDADLAETGRFELRSVVLLVQRAG